jgi:hypothetical protein
MAAEVCVAAGGGGAPYRSAKCTTETASRVIVPTKTRLTIAVHTSRAGFEASHDEIPCKTTTLCMLTGQIRFYTSRTCGNL